MICGCVTLNYNSTPEVTEAAGIDTSATQVVLIQGVEITPVRPGETITAPHVDGVKFWYLMSDFALEKVNKIQIDTTRTQQ